MQWTATAAMASDHRLTLQADADRLRAGRAARRRRLLARRRDGRARVDAGLATRRNGHVPGTLAPSTPC